MSTPLLPRQSSLRLPSEFLGLNPLPSLGPWANRLTFQALFIVCKIRVIVADGIGEGEKLNHVNHSEQWLTLITEMVVIVVINI